MGTKRISKVREFISHRVRKLSSPNEEWTKSWPFRFRDYIYLENEAFNWFYRNVWTNITSFIANVKRTIEWLPIIWQDRDWDHAYILRILKYKLSRVRKCITGNNIIEGATRVGKQIAYAEFLIDRILEDDYHKDEWAKHEKKWGPYCRRRKWTNGSSVGNAHRIRQNATTHQKWVQQHAEEMAIYRKQEATKEKDKDRLFKHLKTYLERWWD